MSKQPIQVENILQPGKTYQVNREKYLAMKEALLETLSIQTPGSTVEEMYSAALPHLPEVLFPQGKAVTWWIKTVQLDLEAKKVIARAETKPLRWYKL